MRIYKGKIDITPNMSLRLGGFAHRVGKSLGVKNRLFLRTLIIEDKNEKVALFTGDILFWDRKIVDELKDIIFHKYGIEKDKVLFSASHNHSGPLLADDMLPEIGEYNSEYIDYLKERAIALVDLSLEGARDVYLELVDGDMNFGVNRRYKEDNGVSMKPNYLGPIDNKCTVLRFINKRSEKIEALMVNYALHANVTDDNYISTDYPGLLSSTLEERYEGSVALFLQGFTGNIRPKLIIGEEFFRGTFDTVENIAKQIEGKLRKIIEKKGVRIDVELESSMVTADLPMDISVQKDNKLFYEKDNGYFLNWLDFLEEKNIREKDSEVLLVQGIRLAEDLIIIALNGEIVTEYGLYLREKYPDIKFLILGYSNGMIGYIATEEQLIEGGYESEDFIYYFGLPGRYSTRIDGIVKGAMEDCIKKLIRK